MREVFVQDAFLDVAKPRKQANSFQIPFHVAPQRVALIAKRSLDATYSLMKLHREYMGFLAINMNSLCTCKFISPIKSICQPSQHYYIKEKSLKSLSQHFKRNYLRKIFLEYNTKKEKEKYSEKKKFQKFYAIIWITPHIKKKVPHDIAHRKEN